MEITKTKLYATALRAFPEYVDVHHYILTMAVNKQGNEWFAPDNSTNELFSICEQLAVMGLIAVRKTPMWVNDSFRGFRIEFFYNTEMDFSTAKHHA